MEVRTQALAHDPEVRAAPERAAKFDPPRGGAGDPMNQDCPGREVFNHITSRWATLVLISLRNGPRRFHVLRDGVQGISEKMLSQTLKTLARDGLVARLVEPTIPPQVSYELTPVGVGLTQQISGLTDWIGEHIDAILTAQQAYDADTALLPKRATK